MNEIIALVLAMIAHEFGHYIHYLALGFKPKLKWVGIGPCIDPEVKDIAVKHVLVNIFIAVNIGIAVLHLAQASNTALFAYFVGCFMDFNNAQMILIYVYRKTIDLNTNVNSIKVVIHNKVTA
jgi:hypothetical protein